MYWFQGKQPIETRTQVPTLYKHCRKRFPHWREMLIYTTFSPASIGRSYRNDRQMGCTRSPASSPHSQRDWKSDQRTETLTQGDYMNLINDNFYTNLSPHVLARSQRLVNDACPVIGAVMACQTVLRRPVLPLFFQRSIVVFSCHWHCISFCIFKWTTFCKYLTKTWKLTTFCKDLAQTWIVNNSLQL